jgi:hypothetical protein
MNVRLVHAVSRDVIESADPADGEDKIIISITDPVTPGYPGTGLANIVACYKSVYRLEFDDWHGERLEGFRMSQGRDPMWFTYDMAEQVAAFIAKWHAYVIHLVVHCEAGVSRSVGLALAAIDHYNIEPAGPELISACDINRGCRRRSIVGNPLVYWLMRAALRAV